MYIVRSGAVDKFDSLVSSMNENPIHIMNKSGLDESQFRDPDTYIAYPRLAALLQIAATECHEPMFGVKLAQQQSLQSLGDLPLLLSRADSVGEALAQVNEYLYLHSSGVTLDITPQRGLVRLSINLKLGCDTGQLMQLSVAQLAKFVASMLNFDVGYFTLYLKQAQPEDYEYSDHALSEIRFNESFNGILIRANLMNCGIHPNQEALERHFQKHLQYLNKRYPKTLYDQASELIARLLSTGECSVERVAKALDLHPRVFQTRLKSCGSSYREILQRVRQHSAEKYLADQMQSITDIALQLGYAEVSVFSRHFRQWTGLSPTQWRQQYIDYA